MSSSDSHSNSESGDFLEEIADVKPLNQDKVASIRTQKDVINNEYRKKVAESFARKDTNFLTDGEVEPVEPEAILNFKLSGIQPGVFKKLKQGKYGFEYHLDLHRKTVAEARNEVYQLLRNANRLGHRSLLITHGKGIMSNPPARLKSYVNHWLQQVDIVVAFHSAQPRHGGTGSVYVLLKKPTEPDKINQAKYD
ncbi:DNA endonuclease SmrA [Aliikangiella coralliicola]|uniref:DNA endonuclease SmrA n=1 Tax=Aliikangiella coralliicola TaxID=2592383 RepID=A0A545U4S3_9GAMM|nr:DNA endonuclease SmrA [Aliikangiella coralliicola]TQV84475.1 DNA endonuclease SmrA [Aliikangiella coralliicola]